MTLVIKPSDLYFRYTRKKTTRAVSKFCGKPDPHPFDRDDLYDVIAMLEAVLATLGSDDGRLLHRVEEVMLCEMPLCVATRAEVFDYLVAVGTELLAARIQHSP